jgi:hypothetical protein
MRNRSQVVDHGAGKGDKPRITDEKTYAENLAEVAFSGVPASEDPTFQKKGGHFVKTYGPKDVEPDVKLTKPIIH